MIGIIGGTGFYDPDFLGDFEKVIVDTIYGSSELFLGAFENREIAFLPRHGASHNIPPHMIDYRKNVMALKVSGADNVISVNSAGSLKKSIKPGSIVIPHDFIDFTSGRDGTFHDNETVHVDLEDPYCEKIRHTLIKSSRGFFDDVHWRGVYVCTQGPRFETPSEIKMLRMLGGDVVGMVGCPEVALAREAGLCYASICLVANYGSGMSKKPLTINEVKEMVILNMDSIKKTIESAVKTIPGEKRCECSRVSKET